MRTALTVAMLAVGLAGCGVASAIGNRLPTGGDGLRGSLMEVEGLRFRSRIGYTTPDRRGFVVTTRDAGRNVAAALEAARLRAVEHCLTGFGESEIAWTLSPGRLAETVTLDGDGAVGVAGLCVAR